MQYVYYFVMFTAVFRDFELSDHGRNGFVLSPTRCRSFRPIIPNISKLPQNYLKFTTFASNCNTCAEGATKILVFSVHMLKKHIFLRIYALICMIHLLYTRKILISVGTLVGKVSQTFRPDTKPSDQGRNSDP